MKLIDFTSGLFQNELGNRCLPILNIAQQLIPLIDKIAFEKTVHANQPTCTNGSVHLIYSLAGLQ